MALLETVDKISEAMDNKKTVGVFIDLSKAFDIVDQNLIAKIRELWIEGLYYQLSGE